MVCDHAPGALLGGRAASRRWSKNMKDWFYDESRHVGVDYSEKGAASAYDEQMEAFRDYEDEVAKFISKLESLDLDNAIAVDVGCGTGVLPLVAAKYFKKIYAFDVSEEMLRIAKEKSAAKNISNIVFEKAGFLNFNVEEKADFVFSKWALHHLPDYWKQAALLNVNSALKKGGLFFLSDFVFHFDQDFQRKTDALLEDISKNIGVEFVEETKLHIREEYSTFDWILQGMLERAGFRIEYVNARDPLASEYYCRKVASLDDSSW